MSIKRGIVVYYVDEPKYEPYKKLESKIIQAFAKRIMIDDKKLLTIEFLQENGSDINSFSWELNFSYKNIEEKLNELFNVVHKKI
jgi:hypothetical protein